VKKINRVLRRSVEVAKEGKSFVPIVYRSGVWNGARGPGPGSWCDGVCVCVCVCTQSATAEKSTARHLLPPSYIKQSSPSPSSSSSHGPAIGWLYQAVAAVAGIVSPLPSGLSHGTPGIAAVLQTSRGPHRGRRLMVMIGNGHTQRPSAGTSYLYGFIFFILLLDYYKIIYTYMHYNMYNNNIVVVSTSRHLSAPPPPRAPRAHTYCPSPHPPTRLYRLYHTIYLVYIS